MWQYFCHIRWFSYFFLTFDGIILTLCSTNVTCDYTFVTFGGSLIFFSHLMIPSSHYIVPTSHMTILLSHSVVLLFFFLTFDGIILTLYSINFTCNYTFVIFGSFLIFSHIRWYHPHIVQYQHHMWLYFCHIRWFPFFFFSSHLIIPFSHCAVPTSHVTVSFIFSHIWWYHPHIVQYQCHMWLYFCHIRWFPYFFSYLIVLLSHYAFNLLILVHYHPQYLENI